jgi:hypothetical protein
MSQFGKSFVMMMVKELMNKVNRFLIAGFVEFGVVGICYYSSNKRYKRTEKTDGFLTFRLIEKLLGIKTIVLHVKNA